MYGMHQDEMHAFGMSRVTTLFKFPAVSERYLFLQSEFPFFIEGLRIHIGCSSGWLELALLSGPFSAPAERQPVQTRAFASLRV